MSTLIQKQITELPKALRVLPSFLSHCAIGKSSVYELRQAIMREVEPAVKIGGDGGKYTNVQLQQILNFLEITELPK